MSLQDRNHPLNIYRASAGSGKTHLLTGFYIKQLFLTDLLPETHSGEMRFSEILAVTFTNKATAEMKGRIISELYLLSQTPRQSDYWDEISREGQRSEDDIRGKATELLIQILNDYSAFNISTIDSFFQRIVRSFARELNVPGNYEVELDSNAAIEAAVSSFLDKLDPHTDKDVFEWMVRFSDKRNEDGQGWDFRRPLLEMATKVLGSEAYQSHSIRIKEFTTDHEQLGSYEKMLHSIVSSWKKQLTETGRQGLALLERYDVQTSELSFGGSGTISQFNHWATGKETDPDKSTRLKEVIGNPDKLFKKNSSRRGSDLQSQIVGLLETGVSLLSGEAYCNYITARFIQQDLYELGIMANIDEELKEYCNERNIMLLSSSTELLSKLIGPYDAPFIYEKTGTYLKSYMIDEFQDTSGMQWHNFMPLVSNTLAQGYQNLIVGDVKQSIYRWRGSDWGLLDSAISRYEPLLHNDNDNELRTNWRSLPSIVEFNNQFFEYIADELDKITNTSQIKRIYKDVRQGLPESKTQAGKPSGLVHIETITPKDESGCRIEKCTSDQLLEEAARQLPLQVIRLQQNGFKPKDIAILCRKKKECRIMAQALLQYKQVHPECPYVMDIVSSEALQLGIRPTIQTVISMMQLLQNPESKLQQAVTQCNYLQLAGTPQHQILERIFMHNTDLYELLPQMAFRPLYELAELLIDKLPADAAASEAPFLQAFRDLVLEFSHSHNADLSTFLDWWEKTGHEKTITTPDSVDAIQIMTIHKSKGLGMPAVIIPFASWELDIETTPTKQQILWCEPKAEPFKKDILLPIRLDKKLERSIFCLDFAEERLRTVIDNLNTAYVAFTRPKEAMIIMIPHPKKDGTRLEHMITSFCTQLAGQPESGSRHLALPVEHTEEATTIGQWQLPEERKRQNEGGHQSDAIILNSNDIANEKRMLPELSILHSPLQQDAIPKRKGNCIHRVLQEIRLAEDLESIVHILYKRGDIDGTIIGEKEMNATIHNLLSDDRVYSWFRPGLRVLTEQTLMDASGNQIRPDRIIIDEKGVVTVIDYKTGQSRNSYHQQVRNYMAALRSLGFHEVKGYLFFIRDVRIVEVRD